MTPRDLLADGHAKVFGRAEEPVWRVPANFDEEVLVGAAQLQHAESLRFRAQLKAQQLTVGEFAELRHVNAEGLRRKLRGETWASLRDIAMWRIDLDTADQ